MISPARSLVTTLTALLLIAVVPAVASAQSDAEHVYIVAHGDTLSSIALRLGVTARALADRNHLHEPYALRVGRRLRLPDDVAPSIERTLPTREVPGGAVSSRHGSAMSSSRMGRGGRRGERDWGRVRHPGVVRLVREATDEALTLNLRRVNQTTQRRMERLLRFGDGRHHVINARLLRQLATVSDHFGGRRLHVISGFRPFRRGQWTAHSNHNIGHAVDFRVEGVPNRVLRDFCRTIPRTGCGFYPRSVFVHMDVREESTTWVDWSRPGQRPMYGREDRAPEVAPSTHAHASEPPAGEADESVDDVAADSDHVRTAPAAAPDEHESETHEEHATAPTTQDTAASPTVTQQ